MQLKVDEDLVWHDTLQNTLVNLIAISGGDTPKEKLMEMALFFAEAAAASFREKKRRDEKRVRN